MPQQQQNLEPIDVSPYGVVAGVDEVGIGPLAGSVVACAVILDPNQPIQDLKDSKLVSEKARPKLAEEICKQALSWSLGSASVAEIDQQCSGSKPSGHAKSGGRFDDNPRHCASRWQ